MDSLSWSLNSSFSCVSLFLDYLCHCNRQPLLIPDTYFLGDLDLMHNKKKVSCRCTRDGDEKDRQRSTWGKPCLCCTDTTRRGVLPAQTWLTRQLFKQIHTVRMNTFLDVGSRDLCVEYSHQNSIPSLPFRQFKSLGIWSTDSLDFHTKRAFNPVFSPTLDRTVIKSVCWFSLLFIQNSPLRLESLILPINNFVRFLRSLCSYVWTTILSSGRTFQSSIEMTMCVCHVSLSTPDNCIIMLITVTKRERFSCIECLFWVWISVFGMQSVLPINNERQSPFNEFSSGTTSRLHAKDNKIVFKTNSLLVWFLLTNDTYMRFHLNQCLH